MASKLKIWGSNGSLAYREQIARSEVLTAGLLMVRKLQDLRFSQQSCLWWANRKIWGSNGSLAYGEQIARSEVLTAVLLMASKSRDLTFSRHSCLWQANCKIWGSHSSIAEDSSLLRCNTVLLGEWLPTPWKTSAFILKVQAVHTEWHNSAAVQRAAAEVW